MRTVAINSANAGNEALRRLYETAFPVGEQIPYDDLIHLLDVMDIDYTAYYKGEMLVGLMMVMRMPRYNWGWYFAVCEPLRGKGYGQQIWSSTLDKYRAGIPLSSISNPPCNPMRPTPSNESGAMLSTCATA